MTAFDNALFLPAQTRELDRAAIEHAGIPGYTLMQRAAKAAYRLLRRRWPEARRLAIVCGVGNNAGDGYVLARLARADGLEARVLQLGGADRLRGDARQAADDYVAAGAAAQPFSPEPLVDADAIVDALLGTGLDRPVAGAWAAAIAAVNASGRPVLAIDIPSGLHGGTGARLGEAVRAAATATFIGRKAGLYTGAGPDHAGDIEFFGLDVPDDVYRRVPPFATLADDQLLAPLGQRRRRGAHKGEFGHVLVVGGDRGMGGAVRMAAEAAARTGAGLTTVATRAGHCAGLLAARPELMCHGVESAAQLRPLLERASVVALGPGLGRGDWGETLLEAVLGFEGPLVVDADALNILSAAPRHNPRWVLTPHPGEAARLLGTSVAAVQSDRFAAADAICQRYGGTVVLKGAGSVVRGASGRPWVVSAGNPGMGSGGMGDTLTGVIAGLIAQGCDAETAAAAGAYVHACAGDRAAREGERGLLAMDLLPHIRALVNHL